MSTPTPALATATPPRATSAAPAPNSFRSLVLPREHGSWSLAFEPVALGLLVAFSPAGAWLALATAAAFFVRRPLKLAATLPSADSRRAAAFRWTLFFSALALAAFFLCAIAPESLRNTQGAAELAPLWPLLLALPFGGAFLWFDLRGEMREAEAELAGSAAFALLPATFATLAGWSTPAALALAALALVRSVPTVLTVRAYLRLQKGRAPAAAAAWVANFAAVLACLILAWRGLVPAFAGVIALVFLARSALLLAPWRPAWSAKRVGQLEAVLGVAFLVGLALAYRTA